MFPLLVIVGIGAIALGLWLEFGKVEATRDPRERSRKEDRIIGAFAFALLPIIYGGFLG